MPDTLEETARLLDLVRLGDEKARNDLIAHACDRFRSLASRMLKGYPSVHRWEQTDDLLQNALLRLCKALEHQQPESVRHFYNLAALQIRPELIDRARHHLGPQGFGANHHTNGEGKAPDDPDGILHGCPDRHASDSLVDLLTFHEVVQALLPQERELVNLLCYQELTQQEVADVLDMPLRTLKRRWQAVRLKLAKVLKGTTLEQNRS